jgi:hypothetical protein
MNRHLWLDILLPFRLIRIREPAARRRPRAAENSRFAGGSNTNFYTRKAQERVL